MSRAPAAMEVTHLATPVMLANPYPRYAYLRQSAPVSWAKEPLLLRGSGGYLLTRYDDVMTVHSDPRFSTDAVKHTAAGKFTWLMPSTIRLLTETMVFKDDPDHKRLRTLVHKAFTPKLVSTMASDISKITEQLADQIAAQREVDLVHDFAVRLPLSVIATMLGVADEDRDKFHRMVEQLSAGAGKRSAMLRNANTARKLIQLFEQLVEQRRKRPDDGLISELVQANESGDKLSDREAVAMVFLLLLAGHDTTANLIGNSVLALMDHPEQQAALRAQPELFVTGIEELLRYTSPVTCGSTRIALEDVEIAGTLIPRGKQVLGMITSANRDEAVFDRPDDLDLDRKPNKHLAFAFGIHYCLGHQLARLEGRIALTTLLQRFPNWELAVPQSQLRYKPTVALRGLTSLPMRMS
jgi:cytochrome P450